MAGGTLAAAEGDLRAVACPATATRRKSGKALRARQSAVEETLCSQKKKVSFGKVDVYFYSTGSEMWRHIPKPRRRMHKNELLPRDASLWGARRAALKLAMDLKYDLSPSEIQTATPAPGNDRHPNRWIADTGSGEDLISQSEAPEAALDEPIMIPNPGPIKVDKRVKMKCEALGEDIQPMMLPQTPAVISVGWRVAELHYEFHWCPGQSPYFIKPSGELVWCTVEDYVPYLIDDPTAFTPGLAAKPMPNKSPAPTRRKFLCPSC